jgi:thiol-disulfide isomerase/thioredoxin
VLVAERKYDYPLPPGTTVTDVISRPHNVKHIPDSIAHSSPEGYQYLAFGAQFVLPNDPYLSPFYNQGNNNTSRSVLFRLLSDDRVAFILDADGDCNFLEEKIDTVPVNKPALIKRALVLTKNGQECPLLLPLEINFQYDGHTFQSMSIRNLLKYQIKYPLARDTLIIDIRTHHLNMQCYLYPSPAKDSILHFRLNEPFLFKGSFYRLTNLDLCDNTITLEKLQGDKIQGYKEGFYIDMVTLRQLTDKHVMESSRIPWGKKPYTLLHFWGEWCDPCRAETPEVKALDEHLTKGKLVQIIHYPFVFKKALLERTLSYIRENNLSHYQSFCGIGDCSEYEKAEEQCDVCGFARISEYPKYILLDQQGKILFLRKNAGVQVVINKLKSLGLY